MLIIKILLTIIIVLYGVRIASEAARSTDGIELYKIQKETAKYQVLNGELKEQIAIAKSLSYINFVARNKMGMVDAEFINL